MTEPGSWGDDNRRGLACSAAGAWDDATESFASSADSLTRNEARDPSAHDALALVLANLAQACFRAGRTEDAIRHAQRAVALRVALCGEDAVAVARSRSDLAVILAASGRIDEAPALLARAIAGIEGTVGDEDLRLAVVLENAARVALAAGQPATAEPFLLRLHGLLGAHELSTDRADMLLVRVFEARVDIEVRAGIEAAPDVAHDTSTGAVPDAGAAGQRATDHDAGWDDQPLRDAVVLTDALLRTTPTGNPVVRMERAALDPWGTAPVEADASADASTDTVAGATADSGAHTHADADAGADVDADAGADVDADAGADVDADAHADAHADAGIAARASVDTAIDADEVEHVETESPYAKTGADDYGSDDIFGAHALELTDALPAADASTASDVISHDAPVGRGDRSEPSAPANAPAPVGGLGFVVQYGVPLESGSHPALNLGEHLELVPESASSPSVEQRATPHSSAAAMPTTAAAAPPGGDQARASHSRPVDARPPSTAGHGPASRPTVHSLDAVPARGRPAPRAPRVATPPKKSPAGLIGGGIAALVAAGAAVWYYMNGGF